MSAVVHSEHIAHRVGEPFGTIILAISVTVIEVALIVTLMLAGGDKAVYLARDTVFAAVMILLTVIMGLCILIGTLKHFEQSFQSKSVNTSLVALIAILVLALIMPNFLGDDDGPDFSSYHAGFVAIVCLVIYATFIYVQTKRHKNYFLSRKTDDEPEHEKLPRLISSLVFLLISLVIVVLLAKTLSPGIEKLIMDLGLPHSLLGIIIASVILLPEAIAAIKAAYKDDIQSSINLSLGSALAAIGLTIPTVAFVSILFDIDFALGLSDLSTLILALSVFTVLLSLSKGRTNIIYGVILICLFATFIFTIIFP
jgi:Ca2+:H+ antiporter